MKGRWSLLGKFGLVVVVLYVMSGVGYLLTGSERHREMSGEAFEAPSGAHWFGTDEFGIDVLAQLVFGTNVSVSIGVAVGLLAGVGGSLIGVCAGYYGGRVDRFVMSVVDTMSAVPMLVVMIVCGVFFQFSFVVLIGLMALMMWVGPARMCRAKVLQLRHEPYIQAARSYGAGFWFLFRRHLGRTVAPMIVMNFLHVLGSAVTMEASLSFLGLGDPTVNSWGAVIHQSINYPGIYYMAYWKWWVVPSVCVLLVFMMAVAFIGRDVEKMVNPKLVR